MIDFLMISTRSTKRGVIEIYPKFIIKKSSDLMIRGGDFYAIWLQDEVYGLRMSKMRSSLLTGNLTSMQRKTAKTLIRVLKFCTCGIPNPE